jgi:hypothetical protein
MSNVLPFRKRKRTVTRSQLRRLHVVYEPIPLPEGVARPWTRGDCKDGPRPCPWVSCVHHLAFDVTPRGGITENFPGLELEDLPDTCSLDVADRGHHTLEEVGDRLNLTRERARQLELAALRKLGHTDEDGYRECMDERGRVSGVVLVVEEDSDKEGVA